MNPARGGRAPHPLRGALLGLAVTALDGALLALALGGLVALSRDARALALLATWAAGSAVLGWMRPVRDQDVVEEDRERPGILVALVLIPLLTPPLSAWTERAGWGVLPGGAALRWSGVALAALGLALRVAAMAQLGRRFSPRVALQRDHALETGGLYARVRHPGYLGALVTNLGAALAFASGPGVALVALLAVAVLARTAREERLMARRFGDAYERYRMRTGAFLPRLGASRREG